jgi:ERCC4-type nuclease
MKLHTLYIDTREQMPLSFAGYAGITVARRKLDFGDYAMRLADGHLVPVVFERKTIPDAFGTLTRGHDRFREEIARAKKSGCKIIILIEGSMEDVLRGLRQSRVQGHVILKTLFTYCVKHGVWVWFADGREEASRYIIEYFAAEWRKRRDSEN